MKTNNRSKIRILVIFSLVLLLLIPLPVSAARWILSAGSYLDMTKLDTSSIYALLSTLLVDPQFDDSADSAALRANGTGQDWYESRADGASGPNLLTLNTANIGGNSTKKAAFASSSSLNAYLTQEFVTPQTGTFTVQWDIYVDSITNISQDPDRAGWMLMGDSTDPTRTGPNSDDPERFVYMGFYKSGGGSTGTMSLVARDRNDAWDAFTTIATGLNLDQWYTIKVICNVPAGSYDVYVNGVFKATVSSRNVKTSVPYISFAQWDDGAGAFYVDNVFTDISYYVYLPLVMK